MNPYPKSHEHFKVGKYIQLVVVNTYMVPESSKYRIKDMDDDYIYISNNTEEAQLLKSGGGFFFLNDFGKIEK